MALSHQPVAPAGAGSSCACCSGMDGMDGTDGKDGSREVQPVLSPNLALALLSRCHLVQVNMQIGCSVWGVTGEQESETILI